MIISYFKTIWRNILKSKTHSIINMAGLAVGFTAFLIILMYLNHELSYDTWDKDLDRVYKISEHSDQEIMERTPAPLGGFLKEHVSVVEASTSISPAGTFEMLLSSGEKKIFQKYTVEADSSFFKVFPFKMARGDAQTALDKPNAIVISQGVAEKLFGQEDPIGKTITVYNSFDCEVTAVFHKPDKPSHLDVEAVYRAPNEKQSFFWTNYSFITYLKCKQAVAIEELEEQINQVYYDHRLKKTDLSLHEFRMAGHQAGLFVEAVQDLHNFPRFGKSNFSTISMLLIFAALLLLQGAINFSNLSIAASIRRAKEVGVKKVMGASQIQLIWQFVGEIALQCLLALGMSLLLLNFILPYFTKEFNLEYNFFQSDAVLSIGLQVLLCLLFVIFLSGLYPAIFLSQYKPSHVLKGNYSRGTTGASFRNSLIIVQLSVSAFFIIGTFVVNSQMHYMQTRDKGFSGEQVIRLEATQNTRDANFETVKKTLSNIPGVKYVSKTTTVPGDVFVDSSTFIFNQGGNQYRMASVKVSTEYFKTLDIDLVQGRMFNNSFNDQNTRNAIINEAAAKKMNLKHPTESFISFNNCDSIPMQIIGVVKDFNVMGYENSVLPVVYTIGNKACMFQSGGAMLVNLGDNDIQNTIAAIEKAWNDIEPEFPIRHSFLDEDFQKLFASHLRLQMVVNFFGIAAITIAMMGLFALMAFLIAQRTREIGIRKVLGAGVRDLSLLLGKDFFRLIFIAVIIALPIGWWAAHEWLDGFAYRITLHWWIFMAATLALIVLAILTIAIQTVKASLANPVDSLRAE